MNVTVLISCMHQENCDIIKRTNIQTDVVVVNQCDIENVNEFNFKNRNGKNCHAIFISTKERGLSKSRNKCLINADKASICLICDDDEVLVDNYEDIIIEAYKQHPYSIVNTFSLVRNDCNRKYSEKPEKIGIKQCLKTSSHQITFNRNLVQKYGIKFDEKMGSGTGNGGGEENKFMFSCYKTSLSMYYSPSIIGTVVAGKSQWFTGYDEKWIYNWGWSMRRALGSSLGLCYIFYFILTHKKSYGKYMNMPTAFSTALKGFFEKR